MTLPIEQARLRAVVLKQTGLAIRHADEAMVQAIHNRLSNSDKRCHKAFQALIAARRLSQEVLFAQPSPEPTEATQSPSTVTGASERPS